MGIILGKTEGFFRDKFIEHAGPEHVLVVSPPRSGKGSGVVIPTLLKWEHSAVVLDYRGENLNLTRDAREVMGQEVLVFNPMATDELSMRYNPLADVRIGTAYELIDVYDIVDLIIGRSDKRNMSQLNKLVHLLLVGVIIHLFYSYKQEGKEFPTLYDVAKLIANQEKFCYLEDLLEYIKGYAHITPQKALSDENSFEILYGTYSSQLSFVRIDPPMVLEKYIIGDTETGKIGFRNTEEFDIGHENFARVLNHPKVGEIVSQLLASNNADLSHVRVKAISYMEIYTDPIVSRNFSGSDFVAEDLISGDLPKTLFLVVEPCYAEKVMPIMNMLISQIIRRALMQVDEDETCFKKQRLLMLLDDFTKLGRMDWLIQGFPSLTVVGINVLLLADSIGKIVNIYGQNNDILDYCKIKLFKGVCDVPTCHYMMELSGKKLTMGNIQGLGYENDILFGTHKFLQIVKRVSYYREREFVNRLCRFR